MKRFSTPIIVILVMLIAILGITNPGFKQPYQLFDDAEGKVVHNYFIFCVYKQYNGHTLSADGQYLIYKRYIGIALRFIAISPSKEKRIL